MSQADAFEEDGTPNYCDACGCRDIDIEVTNTVAGVTSEAYYNCNDCGTTLAFWAYGSFDPAYTMKRDAV